GLWPQASAGPVFAEGGSPHPRRASALTAPEDCPNMHRPTLESSKPKPVQGITEGTDAMPQDSKERSRAIDLALAQIEKQFGKGSIMKLGAKDFQQEVAVISTTSMSID